MSAIHRTVVFAAASCAACAALIPAIAAAEGPALEGRYTRTIVDDNGRPPSGRTSIVVFTPCGPNCTHWSLEGGNGIGFDLHLEGNKWIRDDDGAMVVIDKDTLKGSAALTSGVAGYMTFQLTKIG